MYERSGLCLVRAEWKNTCSNKFTVAQMYMKIMDYAQTMSVPCIVSYSDALPFISLMGFEC